LWLYLTPSPTFSPETGAATGDSGGETALSVLFVLALIVAAVMGISSSMKKQQRFDEAKQRADDMSDEDLVTLDRKLLGRLHRVHGADVTMRELSASAGETYEDACLATERLIRTGLAELVEVEGQQAKPVPDSRRRPKAVDRIRITSAGSRHFLDGIAKERVKVNGDYITVGSNSVVNNRSVVEGSFNTIAQKYSDEFARAVQQLEKAVVESGDPEAKELMDAFAEALASDRRQPSVLKRLFAGVIEAAPAVSAMTNVINTIATHIAQ
jgi:hypothetical protein